MFETSVIRAEAQAATGRFSLLSVSVIAHTAIVVGAVAVSIASVDFPAVTPDEYSRAPVFATVQIPPPLGNPNGGAKPVTQPAVKPPAPQPANQVTAPSLVPETVTPVASTGTGDDTNSNPAGTVEGPIGVPWGTPNSIGDLDAPPAVVDLPVAQTPVEEKVYQPHEVVAPVLVRRVDPRYPAQLQRVGVSATVIVRCIIDKNGSVRNAEVVVPASMAPFNSEVLGVLPQWKYKPATYAGKAVDSYLTVTVHFSIRR
jgi:periplasmic protein TonB